MASNNSESSNSGNQQTNLIPNVKDIRDEAYNFAAKNIKELAKELIQWQDTALLPDGKLRELAAIWAKVDDSNSMAQAEHTAIRAAFDALVQS